MIVVFDLDDTLYDEKTFVYSGLTEVSKWISLKSNFVYLIKQKSCIHFNTETKKQ